MIRKLEFTNISAGWVDAHIRTGNDTQAVDASYLTDAIRDFVDALASLQTSPTATCRWEEEPGELEWSFNRSGDHLIVSVAFWDQGDRKPCFDCSFSYRIFCRDVLDSLNDLKNALGVEGYEKEWGYPFPVESSRKLENAVVSNPSAETV